MNQRMEQERLTIIRRETFSCAHRIFRKEWSDEKNMQVFGPCSWKHFHGHNYVLEVQVTGPQNPDTGYVMDLRVLKRIIQNVLEEFDHRNLNLDVQEFAEGGMLPTTENLAIVIWKRLRKQLPDDLFLRIRLWETEKNSVVYPPLE